MAKNPRWKGLFCQTESSEPPNNNLLSGKQANIHIWEERPGDFLALYEVNFLWMDLFMSEENDKTIGEVADDVMIDTKALRRFQKIICRLILLKY